MTQKNEQRIAISLPIIFTILSFVTVIYSSFNGDIQKQLDKKVDKTVFEIRMESIKELIVDFKEIKVTYISINEQLIKLNGHLKYAAEEIGKQGEEIERLKDDRRTKAGDN